MEGAFVDFVFASEPGAFVIDFASEPGAFVIDFASEPGDLVFVSVDQELTVFIFM